LTAEAKNGHTIIIAQMSKNMRVDWDKVDPGVGLNLIGSGN